MSTVPRIVFDRLVKSGLSPAAAAGLVGNIGMESSFNTGARNAGDGRDGSDSIGISQWNGARATALKQLAAQKGVDWRDPGLQADFIVQELNSTEGRAKQALMAAQDPAAAGQAAIGYFRPAGFTWANPMGGHNAEGRVAEALKFANEFGGLPAQTGIAATPTPMQMPDLSPVVPPPTPQVVETPTDNGFGKALAAFAQTMTAQQPQKPVQVAQSPQMPPIRQDPAPRQRPMPIQATDRGNAKPRRADLSTIFGG